MKQVQISDVYKRLKGLSMSNNASKNNSIMFSEGAQRTIKSGRVHDIKRFIENAGRSESVSFRVVLELFEALAKNGSVSDISKMSNYINENIVHKVRDAKEFSKVLKGRMTRLQHKLEVPKMEVPSVFSSTATNKQEAIKESYESMINKFTIYENCDRMLENYNRISKRFNLELLINENTKINDVYDTVVELCRRIDTYDMPTTVKFNTVIETALYGFESNSIVYEKSEILDAAINYFAFKEDGIQSCKEILDATLFYDKNDDTKNIDILTEDEPEENKDSSSIDDTIRENVSQYTPPVVINEKSEFSEIFEKFKKEELAKDGKPENKLKGLITKLYSRNVDSIVEDTPNLLTWLRSFFIVGSCVIPTIGPILMIVGFIADRFISLHMSAEETKKMIKCFGNEIKKSKDKLESTSDYEEKQKLEKYIESLEKAKQKISTYYMDLSDDWDIEDEYDSMSLSNDSGLLDDEDFNFNFEDDLDFNFSEMANTIERIESCYKTSYISETLMYNLPSKLNDDGITDMSKAITYFPEVFCLESFSDGLRNEYNKVRSGNMSAYDRIIRQSVIKNAIDILESSNNAIDLDKTVTIHESNKYMSSIANICEAIDIVNGLTEDDSSILEASFSNSLKLAGMKLRNSFKKMSDKEKNISRSVDVGLNNLTKSVEKAMTTDNRESVLRGSILPSASKIIKMGIVNAGLAVFISPVLAVIATLGYLGCSTKFKAKERQMLVDEIEIEIKMCDKYIEIAEQKNDMKALKQLLTTKRELERQQQRIKYKMRIQFGQKYYDAKQVGDQ